MFGETPPVAALLQLSSTLKFTHLLSRKWRETETPLWRPSAVGLRFPAITADIRTSPTVPSTGHMFWASSDVYWDIETVRESSPLLRQEIGPYLTSCRVLRRRLGGARLHLRFPFEYE